MRINTRFSILILLIVGICTHSLAQQQLKPGHVYSANDSLYGPINGIKAVVPMGWLGILPQGSQVFTLMTEMGDQDNIFVFASESDLEAILESWRQGVEIEKGVNATLNGEPEVSDEQIYAEFVKTDDPKKMVIGIAKCGEFGKCATIFAFTSPKRMEGVKKGLVDFTNSLIFVKPGLENLYDNFNWVDYLKGKYIFNYQSNQYYRKEGHVWLCDDGTFKSKLKRTGIIKEDAKEYKGKKSGTYELSGKGQFGTITFNFKNLAPVEVKLEIRDDKVYVNGIQQFVSNHSTCK